jgi:hypothetical protein
MANEPVNKITDEQMVKILQKAKTIKKYIEAVEKEALDRLKNGEKIPGLKLVAGRSSRQWSIPDEEVEAKLRKMGVPKEEIYEKTIVSVAGAEKLKWIDKKTGETECLSVEQTEMIQQNYVTVVPGRPTVALETDARKEIAPPVGVSGFFKPIEQTNVEPFKLFKE